MVKNEKVGLVRFTLRETLLTFVDLGVTFYDIFESKKINKKPIREYQNWRELDRERWNQNIYRLKTQGLVKVAKSDKEKCYQVTQKGLKKAIEYCLDDLKIEKQNKWDKKFRIVIFDIPEKMKENRRIFRNRLKLLGFTMLQKSIFIIPWPCEKIVNYLIEIYEIEPYVIILTADKIQDSDVLKKVLKHYFE